MRGLGEVGEPFGGIDSLLGLAEVNIVGLNAVVVDGLEKRNLVFGFVPTAVGGEVSRAVEDLLTLGTLVLNVNNHGTPRKLSISSIDICQVSLMLLFSITANIALFNSMTIAYNMKITINIIPVLCKSKCVSIHLLTQSAEILPNVVLYLGQLLYGLISHLNRVQSWVNIAYRDGIILDIRLRMFLNFRYFLAIYYIDVI